jgi:hypothetical protein
MAEGKLAVTGFEAASPAHGGSAVGGVTHLFHMLFRGNPGTKTPPDTAKLPPTKPSTNKPSRARTSSGPSVSVHAGRPPEFPSTIERVR